ncbi:hypothetical protein C8R46DRAFT_1088780 [Mycena filopes]|nr:hypothetical protein C8R46DRAFT_1088780 [Mycena filopes]
MPAVSLKLLFSLGLGLATAFPVQLPSAQDETHAAAMASAVPRSHADGNRLFASAQWERSAPSRVRDARDPQSTIFDHKKWESHELEDSPAHSTTLLFAHDQWEENEEKDASLARTAEPEARERGDSGSEGVAKLEVGRRQDTSTVTGPVFFAHEQWEE